MTLSAAIFADKHEVIAQRLAEGQVPNEEDMAHAVRAKAVDRDHGYRNYEYDLTTAGLLSGFMTEKTKEAFKAGVAHIEGATSAGLVGHVSGREAMRDLVDKAVPQDPAKAPALVVEKAVEKEAPKQVATKTQSDLPKIPSIPRNAGLDFSGRGGGGLSRA